MIRNLLKNIINIKSLYNKIFQKYPFYLYEIYDKYNYKNCKYH